MKNEQVAQAWKQGEYAHNDKNTMHTDGYHLYSYNMLIGITLTDGKKISLNGHTPYRVSQTTSTHCRFAARVADESVDPEIAYPGASSYCRYAFPRELTSKSLR